MSEYDSLKRIDELAVELVECSTEDLARTQGVLCEALSIIAAELRELHAQIEAMALKVEQ